MHMMTKLNLKREGISILSIELSNYLKRVIKIHERYMLISMKLGLDGVQVCDGYLMYYPRVVSLSKLVKKRLNQTYPVITI
tara:strand:- start:2449 stop:2691 length:243 start_codon:yes stop_codon:yes gene_type:complete